jgi:mRNA interferase MazF
MAGGGDYTSKPRPALIVQDDSFDAMDSITVCPLTTDPTDLPLFRIPLERSERNGLSAPSRIMIDKIMSVRRTRLRAQIGTVDDVDLLRVNRAIATFLGLGSATRRRRRS